MTESSLLNMPLELFEHSCVRVGEWVFSTTVFADGSEASCRLRNVNADGSVALCTLESMYVDAFKFCRKVAHLRLRSKYLDV